MVQPSTTPSYIKALFIGALAISGGTKIFAQTPAPSLPPMLFPPSTLPPVTLPPTIIPPASNITARIAVLAQATSISSAVYNNLDDERLTDPKIALLAEDCFKRTLLLNVTNEDAKKGLAKVNINKARNFWRQRLIFDAQTAALKALEFDPKNTAALVLLADWAFELNDHNQAMEFIKMALEIDHHYWPAYTRKGVILIYADHLSGANHISDKLKEHNYPHYIRKGRKDDYYHVLEGELALAKKHVRAAENHYDEMRDKDSELAKTFRQSVNNFKRDCN